MAFLKKAIILLLVIIICGFVFNTSFAQGYDSTYDNKEQPSFEWPHGIEMGLSLTFDDARLTQVDKGIPILDKYGVKSTFYVSPNRMSQRVAVWKKAIQDGHEMEEELRAANELINDSLGIEAVSFAYPCGQTFVGKGLNARSYVPVVSSLFETGRGWLDEGPNDPAFCDMGQLTGMELDGKSFEEIIKLIESAKSKGQWLILAGHEINDDGFQTSKLSTIEAICKYATDPSNEVWIDNVHNIASYVKEKRGEMPHTLTPVYKNPLYPNEQRIEDLLSRMTLKEKVGQMNIPCVYKKRIGWGLEVGEISIHKHMTLKERQTQMEGCRKFARGDHNDQIGPGGGFFTLADRIIYEGTQKQAEFFNELQEIAINESRLGIPVLQIEEGTHGFMCAGGTIFPEGLAMGSTWNMDLIKRIYQVIAKEGRATGAHMLCTIVIEPNRDPRLGRNQEGYSEDPYMCSRIAENIVTAMQGYDVSGNDKVIAALSHYPGQSEPLNGLERGAMEISERKLRNVFLPPWEAGINKCGALAVMATYPAIDGITVHSSKKLLKNILREELGFEGIVLSEGRGINTIIDEHMAKTQKEAGQIAVKAGIDVGISMEDAYLGPLVESVEEGVVPMEDIDDAVRNILNVKFKLGLFENPYVDPEYAVKVVHSEEHQKLALEAAREGIVLLKNENNLLPLSKNIKSIAVIGPNANEGGDQIGDYIPHHIPQEIVTVLKGIKNKVSSTTKIEYVKGCNVIGEGLNEIEKAKNATKNAEIAIVVIGEMGNSTNGEGRDVASLDLTGLQQELLEAVHSTGTPTIVALINGRPLSTCWAAEHIPAIVEAWMCGEQGGNAVADVLFGDYNPNGKLPVTIPRHSGQLPAIYNHSKTKKAKYIDMPATPLYYFGHGLSYTDFEYSNLQISPSSILPGGEVQVTLDVKNTGRLQGKEVVQLYIKDEVSSVTTPIKQLRGFRKINLNPGEEKSVSFTLRPEDLSLLDRNMKWIVEPGVFNVMAGSSSADIRLEGHINVNK